MPRYVLHIGPHKTGTSYLQVLFRELAAPLRARGILYPEQWSAAGVLGHTVLIARLRAGDHAALAREFEPMNRSEHELVLISAEDLANLTVEQLAALRDQIDPQPVDVVFYCRRWLDLLPSVWQELIKHGRTVNLPEFIAIQLANPAASTPINYTRTLDRFAAVFGLESLRIASYSNILDTGASLAEHFFRSFLGWPDAPGLRRVSINASLTLEDTEMIRVLNSLASLRGATPGVDLRVRYLKMRERLELEIPFAAMERHRASLFLDENAGGLRVIHDEIFRKYGNRLVPPASGREWFCRRQGELRYINETHLLEPGVLQAMDAVYASLQA
jgi:hypothetical protein